MNTSIASGWENDAGLHADGPNGGDCVCSARFGVWEKPAALSRSDDADAGLFGGQSAVRSSGGYVSILGPVSNDDNNGHFYSAV